MPASTLSYEERRQRREERREKQRAQNVDRAKAMHMARLEWEAEHELADSPPALSSHTPPYHVGCSGWFYWHWRDCFYPPKSTTHEWFDHYAARFRTVELNAPFYSWPTIQNIKLWRSRLGRKRFVYTVKVCELITHLKRFSRTGTLVRDFGYIADLLGPSMGCFLFQCPPSFHYTPARLASIVRQLDPRRRNVVEFRHRTWWNDKVYRAFEDHNITFCSVSGPRLPDDLIRTSDEIYLRFHGTQRWYRHDYTPQELAIWTQRVRDSGAKRVWAYFNNDRDGYAIKNATELARQLKGD